MSWGLALLLAWTSGWVLTLPVRFWLEVRLARVDGGPLSFWSALDPLAWPGFPHSIARRPVPSWAHLIALSPVAFAFWPFCLFLYLVQHRVVGRIHDPVFWAAFERP
jgi:hypothetical protein